MTEKDAQLPESAAGWHHRTDMLTSDAWQAGYARGLAAAAQEIERLRAALGSACTLCEMYAAERNEAREQVAAERERAVLAVTAVRIAAECIRAVYSEEWAAFDRLSDEFDDAVSAVGETCGSNSPPQRAADPPDVADIIAGALHCSRGYAYDLMHAAIAAQRRDANE